MSRTMENQVDGDPKSLSREVMGDIGPNNGEPSRIKLEGLGFRV